MWKSICRVLFWRYERGSWQYDILVLLILAFIFLTPPWFFRRPVASNRDLRPEVHKSIEEQSDPVKSGPESSDQKPQD